MLELDLVVVASEFERCAKEGAVEPDDADAEGEEGDFACYAEGEEESGEECYAGVGGAFGHVSTGRSIG